MFLRYFESVEYKVIHYALLWSIFLHAVFLVVCYFMLPQSVKARLKNVEIIYHGKAKPRRTEAQAATQLRSLSDLREVKRNLEAETDRMLKEKAALDKTLLKDISKINHHGDSAAKQISKIPDMVEKRSITVPVLSSQRITIPQYISYNDRIRAKIRNRAYFYIDDPDFQAGDVYMSFVLTSDGQLKDLQVLENRSRANNYLRQVGLRSIKESSPFPPFPPELKYPELSFNVVISFEVGK